MGVGLAGITIIFLALPGVLLAVFARLGKEDSALPVIMDAGWKVLATAATGGFLIHFITFFLCHWVSDLFTFPGPDLVIAGILLGIDDSALQVKALENVQLHLGAVSLYQLTAIALSLGFALVVNKFPTEKNWLVSKLDELLAMDNPVVWMTVAMEFDGEIWLFAGIYEKHINNKSGEPEYIMLQLAKRRRLADDDRNDAWTDIPGESLILHLDGWHSVNVDAMYIQDEPEIEPEDRNNDAIETFTVTQAS